MDMMRWVWVNDKPACIEHKSNICSSCKFDFRKFYPPDKNYEQQIATIYDHDEPPEANMYGCLPCPNCHSKYRVPYNVIKLTVECDDCSLVQDAVRVNE